MHGISEELTLDATHAYICPPNLESLTYLCRGLPSETEHDELRQWLASFDPTQRFDTLRACLFPRRFQLEAGLAAYQGKNTIVNAGTGSGKTLSTAIPLLMNPKAVVIIVSPLKRLQSSQAQELERLIKSLAIDQHMEPSQFNIKVKVYYVVIHLGFLH